MKQALLLLLLSPALMASEWVSNKDHSEIQFKVSYLSVSEVSGRFNEFQAKTSFDEKTMFPTDIDIVIDSNSIDTNHKLRDGHLKGSDFFSANAHPKIFFKGEKIIRLGKGQYEAEGKLTIKNVTRPKKIRFQVSDSVKDTWGHENKFVKFKSTLNRKDFNIKWNKTLDEEKYLVGDEVEFWGVFQLQPPDGKTPPSKHMIPDTEYIRGREQLLRDQENESGFSKKLRKLINGN